MDEQSALDVLLAAESSPVERRPRHYVVPALGGLIVLISIAFAMLVALPAVASVVADWVVFFLRLASGE